MVYVWLRERWNGKYRKMHEAFHGIERRRTVVSFRKKDRERDL
jgi:hypothetical protein